MHELTNEEQSKGGSVKTIKKAIAKSITTRTKCDSSCPIWPCLLQYKVDTKDFNCVLTSQSVRDKNIFSKLFFNKEEGIDQILLENAFLLSKDLDGSDPFFVIKIQEALINTKKAIYGSKKTVKIDRSQAIYEVLQDTIIDVESDETN